MKRRQILLSMAGCVGLGLLCCAGQAWSQSRADRKAELVKLAESKRYFLQALILDKLVQFDLTPAWWEVTLQAHSPDYEANWYQFLDLAHGISGFAKAAGWGDAVKLDRDTGGEAKNPLVREMVETWKKRLSGRVVLKFPVDERSRQLVFHNVGSLVEPMSNPYYLKPRGGEFHFVVEVSAKATKTTGAVSKDGNDYKIVVPAYLRVGPAQIEPIYRKGHQDTAGAKRPGRKR